MKNRFALVVLLGLTYVSFSLILACNTEEHNHHESTCAQDDKYGYPSMNSQNGQNGQKGRNGQDGGNGENGGNSDWGNGGNGGNGGDAD
jgi:hypothetical protein